MFKLFPKSDPLDDSMIIFARRFGLSEHNTALCQRAFADGWMAAIAGLDLDRAVKSFGLDEPILETFVERGWTHSKAVNRRGDRP